MAKKTKAPKKKRTQAEKDARNLKRKQRRSAKKEANVLKAKIDGTCTSTSTTAPLSVFPWAEKTTSDGLPFSQSVDNKDSLLGQLKAEREMVAEAQIRKPSKTEYAGWAPQAVLHSTID